MSLSVSGIFIYPVKSCAGISLTEAEITPTGFAHDREWMIVKPDGVFITQRQNPKLALIRPTLIDNGVRLSAPEKEEITIPIITDGKKISVTVWESTCDAIDQGDDVAEWLSAFIDMPCRMVRMDPQFQRLVKEKHQQSGKDVVSFADALPFLLTTEASLDDLNGRLEKPVPMNRFRPNIVVAGGNAYQEDDWKKIKIGTVDFAVVKPCVRCEITTVDQETGEKGIEPLQTLGTYHVGPKGTLFGQNCIQLGQGIIHVGDKVALLE